MQRRFLIAFFAVIALVLVGAWTLPKLEREVLARNCVANMKSIGYQATVWARRNGNTAPTNWMCFSDELITPKMMICPADSRTTPVREWTSFRPESTSYEILGGGGCWNDRTRVFFRCRVHGYVCLADGLVSRKGPVSQ